MIGCPQLMEWGLSICNVPGSGTPGAHLMRPNLELQIVKWFPNPQLAATTSTSSVAEAAKSRQKSKSKTVN